MSRHRCINHIDTKSESLCHKAVISVWWEQRGVVYYEILKPGETVNTKRYQQQLTDLNSSLLQKARKLK